jgi:hypothetical protein
MKIAKKDLEINEKQFQAKGAWFCKNKDMIIQGLEAAQTIVSNFWARLFIGIALSIVKGLAEKYCPVK